MEKVSENARLPINIAEWDREMGKYFNAQRISDPNLLKAAEDYAKHLGVKTPLLYVAEEFSAMCGGKMPNALVIPSEHKSLTSAIAFSPQKFTTLGYNLHSGATVRIAVLFSLGQEMGQTRQGGQYPQTVRKYPKPIGLRAVAAGIFLLDVALERAGKQQKEKALSNETIHSALGEVAEEEREKIKNLL